MFREMPGDLIDRLEDEFRATLDQLSDLPDHACADAGQQRLIEHLNKRLDAIARAMFEAGWIP